jgi:hypothetical protein
MRYHGGIEEHCRFHMKRITLADLIRLPPKEANFVVEYVKDFAARRAAEASGYSPDYGHKLVEKQEISEAIEYIIQKRLEDAMIDTDWLLYEMVDNHMIARQQGNITASNTALSLVGKHKRIDAFAADKIKVTTDADVVERLVAARKRVRDAEPDDDDDISFF